MLFLPLPRSWHALSTAYDGAARDEQEQAMTIKRHPAIGTSDMAAIEAALRQGASRRDLMRWLGAAGTVGGDGRHHHRRRGPRARPDAQARRPGQGRLADLVDRRHPRSGQAEQPDRLHALLHLLQRADATRRQPDAAARARRIDRERQRRHGLDDQAPQATCKFHDGTPLTADDVVFSLARHKDPATGSKAKALAAPDEGNRSQRHARGEDHPRSAQRGPAGRARHARIS